MKKKCDGCRALTPKNYCGIGFKTKGKYFYEVRIGASPLENCPKPKTIQQYLDCVKN